MKLRAQNILALQDLESLLFAHYELGSFFFWREGGGGAGEGRGWKAQVSSQAPPLDPLLSIVVWINVFF